MRIGLGHLRLPAPVFWAMSLPEFFAAMDGYLESKGVKRGADATHLTAADVDDVFAQFDDEGRPIHG